MLAPIAVTAGEPAGIGPELCAMLLRQGTLPAPVVIIADRDLIEQRARALGLSTRFTPFEPDGRNTHTDNTAQVLHVPLARPAVAGAPDPANSPCVLRTLEIAADGCNNGLFSAMVTAPVHKGVINDAGIPFTGHTEFLAHRLRAAQVVMLLVGGGMRVALATTHLALRDVAAALTQDGIERVLRVLHHGLVEHFGIGRPRILVAGLNPHAGESGHLGREEIDVIEPVLHRLRADGFDVTGPLPADTLFQPRRLAHCDAVLAMYHDQGLPVLKYASFGSGVNVTLGLPVIRTSVDHGTALDLAGTGKADVSSLQAALDLAAELVQRRSATNGG